MPEGSEPDETDELLEVGIAIIIDALVMRLLDGAVLQRDPLMRAASKALNAAGGWTLALAIDELACELKQRVGPLPESSVQLADEFGEDALSSIADDARSARNFWLKEFNQKGYRIPEVMRRRRVVVRMAREIGDGNLAPRSVGAAIGYGEKHTKRLMDRIDAIHQGALIAVVQLLDEARRKTDRSA